MWIRSIACTLLLALLAACTAAVDRVDPQFELAASEGTRIWVDTDAAELPGQADPDDLIALEVLHGARAQIAGISTIGGNADHATVWATATSRATWAPLHKGGASCTAPGVVALAETLRRERLRILALGPLTNIATLLICHPHLADRIEHVTAVASRSRGEKFHLGGFSLRGNGLRDLNFEVDPEAFRVVVEAGVFLRFAPFSAGNKVRFAWGELTPYVDSDLDKAIKAWANTLVLAGGGQTIPAFDPVAVAAELWPDKIICQPVEVVFERNDLIAELAQGGETEAERCWPEDPARVKALIMGALRNAS